MVNALSCLLKKKVTEDAPVRDEEIDALGREIRREVDTVFGGSIAIRELDTGSDNAAEIEINNLSNPYYDVERFGITFVASPRHADVLLVTGPVTTNMREALKRTYDATPDPKWVVAMGDCAFNGGVFAESYAVVGGVSSTVPVDLHIKGCPPTPTQLLEGLLALLRVNEK